MFRTRILEVVCFLGTCFFQEDVMAGLEREGKGLRFLEVPMAPALHCLLPSRMDAPVHVQVMDHAACVEEAMV